jgi:hypothetical protein
MPPADLQRVWSLVRQLQGSLGSTPTAVTAFSNSWVNYDTDRIARYWKMGDTVFLAGIIRDGTIGATAFTLPAGFTPKTTAGSLFPVVAGGAFGFVAVYGAGDVIPTAGNNSYLCLDGIAFPVT